MYGSDIDTGEADGETEERKHHYYSLVEEVDWKHQG